MKYFQNFTPKKALTAGLTAIGFLLIAAVIINLTSNSNKTTTNNTGTTPPIAVVQLSDTAFTPATISVSKGTVVEWTVSNSQKTHIIASNPYPADTSVPSLKSKQIGNGVSYDYQFNKTGTFSYHDDLNPTISGVVTVH